MKNAFEAVSLGHLTLKNRLVRSATFENGCGKDYPVLIKINYSDLIEGGFSGEDCRHVCAILAEREIDAIEISSGWNISRLWCGCRV